MPEPVTQRLVAESLVVALEQLKKRAEESELDLLAYWIDCALAEARFQAIG